MQLVEYLSFPLGVIFHYKYASEYSTRSLYEMLGRIKENSQNEHFYINKLKNVYFYS